MGEKMNPNNFRNQSIGLRGMLIVILNEFKAFKSNLGSLVYMTIQPFLYYAFLVMGISYSIGPVKYRGLELPYSAYAVVGVIGLIMTMQMSNAIYRSTVDKQFGLMAIKFLSGVKPVYYVLGMSNFPIMGYLYQSLILYFILILTGINSYVPNFIVAVLVGTLMLIFWSSLGIFCSAMFKNYQQRDIVIQLVFAPIAFTAPSFYLDGFGPKYLILLSDINPLTYQLRALRSIAYGKWDISLIIISLIPTIIMFIVTCATLKRIHLTLQER
ncbi:ABC transporter permease [Fructilactobacillus ixorae]|uniref:Transport permease protein n=1 Tax=Fructilactobacillus ixorae TaxID=1750535 RepID=A0ABY5C8T2_9LACO|nr:ABC transporter permease [Fructilactobacillus ixorae]USS93775.1 ABC transporter permease [Fructilactobacillus ixorae]